MDDQLLVGLVLVAIPVLVVRMAIRDVFERERQGKKAPFTQKLLRPAGESLRLKIAEIEDTMHDHFLLMCCLAAAPAITTIVYDKISVGGRFVFYITVPCLLWIGAAWQWRKIAKLRNTLRIHRLGFDGERYIASELDLLMRQGYRVFHDFVIDDRPGGCATDFNIDHIAVGPAGIIAFETKTRRKPKDQDGKPARVRFDGCALSFDGGPLETEAMEQAENNAKELRRWLEARLPFQVRPRSMLMIPGWWVDDEGGREDLKVYNGKHVARQIAKLPNSIRNERELELISRQLENHCRDVDSEARSDQHATD